MGKMICFMGKSSAGKDTIFRRLLEDGEPGFRMLVPYTTRPIRNGEQDGREYHFTDEESYRKLAERGRIIEERSYDTCHGIWRYFTVDDGSIDLEKESYGIIGTLEAYNKMCFFWGRDRVVPILIDVDDGVRLQRALDRERRQEHPKYEEMCRRYLADEQDFAEERIRAAGIERRFDNDNLERCLKEIKGYLTELI